ncbi:hypothetical protein HPB51_010919 [Rhipicephalus microplus]|uniref:MgsA AAA+ ATPase C-terminal domain-containing protein n=1 Tax=Rhipicephalus microplus TaxID=6941 RepID=A0A9J6D4Y6_RHIMP|nr:hypothetical protein HPB51_010919 [Rhipicephalus microplus]
MVIKQEGGAVGADVVGAAAEELSSCDIAEIMLSHCATYCARAPKSRETYNAYARAEEAVQKQEGPLPAVPVHLRNHASPGQRAEGRSKPFLPQQLAHLDFFK